MSGNLSSEYDQTIWVVARLDPENWENGQAVEELGYWDKARADKRANHILEHDKHWATVWPVRFWAPIKVTSDNVPPQPLLPPLIVGAVTQGRGQELHAYAEDKSRQLSLPFSSELTLAQTVAGTWNAWRLAQADAGNFDEAAQEPMSTAQLESLYEGRALEQLVQP